MHTINDMLDDMPLNRNCHRYDIMANKEWTVLVVDDDPIHLQHMKHILADRYNLVVATSGVRALQVVEKTIPDLILLDIVMPGMDGYRTCRRLKSDPRTANVPVIFVTGMAGDSYESRSFEAGAVDFIAKPVSEPVVLARIATQLAQRGHERQYEEEIRRRTAELEATQRAAVYMLGEAGDYNDTDTGLHIWRLAAYSAAIARAAGWSDKEIEYLELAAPMHDAGKIGIPDSILKKKGVLDATEWEIMKTHTTIGYGILSKCDSPLFRMAAQIALSHHEKWDGTGYPEGLKGEQIPECARVVAIADVFDALTKKRPYKKAWSIEDALEEIRKQCGSHFDPKLCESFFSIEAKIRKFKEIWDQEEMFD